MQSWEILQNVIPRGEAERIAKLMRVTPDTVRKWCRQPEADDNIATGLFNPVETLMLLFDALRARKLDEGIDDILDYINSDDAAGRRISGQGSQKSEAEAEKELREAARRCNEAADLLAGKHAHGKRERVRS
jgi:hypothetical protein